MGVPKIIDLETVLQCGMDPKTGLPLKLSNTANALKSNLKKNFRIMDEQNAINRYT